MTKPLPSLALDMSQDGIALHQLSFDGHWHELARVALNNAALRERLSNMKSVATKLEGRGFRAQIWLPAEQILLQDVNFSGVDESARPGKARAEMAANLGGKPSDYTVQIGAESEAGAFKVAAVRIRTLQEAKTFAKSHGFRARGYSTQNAVEGFSAPPCFDIPADKVKVVGLGLVAATAAALVLGGGYSFYRLDPFNMWELPPRAADFAPFQQPNPSIERGETPVINVATDLTPLFPEFAYASSTSVSNQLPYLPPRQLTAEALETVLQPEPLNETEAPAPLQTVAEVSVNWPAPITALLATSARGSKPIVGRVSVLDRLVEPPHPIAEAAPEMPSGPMARYRGKPRPIPVANTAFYLEPLPAMGTRLSPDALAAFASRSGLSPEQLSRMASPLLLIESKLVEVIPGLPPILPRLRSGQVIPEQVEPVAPPPPIVEVPTGPAPLFSLVSGQPDIVPPRRPLPPVVVPPAEVLPFTIINGTPAIRPLLRVVPEPVVVPEIEIPIETSPEQPVEPENLETPVEDGETPVADPQSETEALPEAETPVGAVDAALAAAVDAAIDAAQPEEPARQEFALLEGQPQLLPRLRSGAVISPQVFANAAPQNLDPATAEANALRPRRRPQAIIDLPAPVDPVISGAAPANAERPKHRGNGFAASVARITEIAANRPRVTAPPVPADPQSVNLPSSASVARAATIENAINLRQTNLIGVFGTADARTALIRLSSGRIVRVQLGEKFSGWTVVAIAETTVRVRKRNREEILRMPAE